MNIRKLFKLAALPLMLAITSTTANAQENFIKTGVLECSGEGGWGMILGSQKTMRCTFSDATGKPVGVYDAKIMKYGLDIGQTGKTTMVWAVFAPPAQSGGNYRAGSLAGQYTGVTAEASVGVGVGADALLGGGANSFALQPVSVKTQTGLNLAVGVGTLSLKYAGPAR
jgi:hypothetical protein